MDQTRLKLTIAYDGGGFRGWQSQATKDGVQDHLESAFAALVGQRVVVHGSGRTDSGVHALGQVAHVDVPAGKFAPGEWQAAVNGNLPPTIRVLRMSPAPADFHARFDTRGKIYSYRIYAAPILHPLELGRVWHMPIAFDDSLMRDTAQLFCGTHDFAGFAANRGRPGEDTTRTLRRIQVSRQGSIVTLRFEGDGFLYKMVRLITGSLVRCAQGRATREWITALLNQTVPGKTNFAAPAQGLFLTRVLY